MIVSHNLTKLYGAKVVDKDLSFTVHPGVVTEFLRPAPSSAVRPSPPRHLGRRAPATRWTAPAPPERPHLLVDTDDRAVIQPHCSNAARTATACAATSSVSLPGLFFGRRERGSNAAAGPSVAARRRIA